jgi:hypothetical protein
MSAVVTALHSDPPLADRLPARESAPLARRSGSASWNPALALRRITGYRPSTRTDLSKDALSNSIKDDDDQP